jgi:hypothetical protein
VRNFNEHTWGFSMSAINLCIAELVTPMSPQDRNELRRQRHRGGRRFGFHVPQGPFPRAKAP